MSSTQPAAQAVDSPLAPSAEIIASLPDPPRVGDREFRTFTEIERRRAELTRELSQLPVASNARDTTRPFAAAFNEFARAVVVAAANENLLRALDQLEGPGDISHIGEADIVKASYAFRDQAALPPEVVESYRADLNGQISLAIQDPENVSAYIDSNLGDLNRYLVFALGGRQNEAGVAATLNLESEIWGVTKDVGTYASLRPDRAISALLISKDPAAHLARWQAFSDDAAGRIEDSLMPESEFDSLADELRASYVTHCHDLARDEFTELALAEDELIHAWKNYVPQVSMLGAGHVKAFVGAHEKAASVDSTTARAEALETANDRALGAAL